MAGAHCDCEEGSQRVRIHSLPGNARVCGQSIHWLIGTQGRHFGRRQNHEGQSVNSYSPVMVGKRVVSDFVCTCKHACVRQLCLNWC